MLTTGHYVAAMAARLLSEIFTESVTVQGLKVVSKSVIIASGLQLASKELDDSIMGNLPPTLLLEFDPQDLISM